MSNKEKRGHSSDSMDERPTTNRVQESEVENDEDEESSYEDYGTPIRSRQRFTADETRDLEQVFSKTNRPSSDAKQKLAVKFNTTSQRIQIWFQNRRAKEKKNNPVASTDGGSTTGFDGTSVEDSYDNREENILLVEHGESSRKQDKGNRQGQRKKRRRIQGMEESSVQLRPSGTFYHGSQEEHFTVPNYPFSRRIDSNSLLLHEGRWYYSVPPSTVNPADMEPSTAVPFSSADHFNIEQEGYLDDGYTDDPTSLDILADTSTSQQPNVDGSERILTHEDIGSLQFKGEFHLIL